MTDNNSSEAKARLMMKVVDRLFKPEILYENHGIQGRGLREPMVIICNHSVRTKDNFLLMGDGPVLRYVFENRRVCSLMAKDLMEKPVMKSLMKGCDCIPVCRDAASTDWIHKCREKLSEGTSVIIFPEGTTIKENDFEEFKSGFALLAKIADVRVLPVAINGIYKPFTKGELKIKIGTPQRLRAEKMSPAALKAEAVRFREITEDMYYDMKNDCGKRFPVINDEKILKA